MNAANLTHADFGKAILTPSPNFGARAAGAAVDMILLHYTGMPDDAQALKWLCEERSQVSSHYFLHKDGTVHQLVSEKARAWHAGKAFWQGERDINSCSIGIEIANAGHEHGYSAFPDNQIAAVIALCHNVLTRHDIPPERILAHSDVAPARKKDPGELFPWGQLAESGIGHFLPALKSADSRFLQMSDRGPRVSALQAMLALYGYDCPQSGLFDTGTCHAVMAFQRHFRPVRVDGIADYDAISLLYRLLRALPKLSASAEALFKKLFEA